MDTKKNKTQDLQSIKLSKPAQRALQNAGVTNLKQLTKFTEEEVAGWHGIGPNTIMPLKKALKDSGLSFATR
jgi:hypothetical protein